MSRTRAMLALSMMLLGMCLMGADLALAQDKHNDPNDPNGTAKKPEPVAMIGDKGLAGVGRGVGAGLVVMGGAAGIGRIGGSAVESMARQPEAAGTINTAMLITAAMIEGATLFGVLVCLLT